jgi:hypothetical protein
MKVSRKVGRRIRKHTSSISRRRLRSKKSYKKNSYRKKYTQKGGCWGTSNKGGARGRKYKSARAHTHKRGKRFHRGGNGTELGNISLEYKKNDGRFLTSSDTKMFTARLFKDSDELHLTRCSGNTTESCNSVSKSPILLFILPFATSTLVDFNDSTSNLVLEGLDSVGNSSGVKYTFFANPLNKNSFTSLLPRINNLATEPSKSPLAPTIFASVEEETQYNDANPDMARRLPRSEITV